MGFNLAFAQQHHPPQAGDNFPNPALDKFVGTWIWTSGDDTVKIILKKENILFPRNFRKDVIIGFHLYKKDSVIVESSLQFQHTNRADGKSTILAGSDNNNNFILKGSLTDLTKGIKFVEIKLTMNSLQNKLTLVLRETPGLRYGDTSEYGTFRIPNNITLNRHIELPLIE